MNIEIKRVLCPTDFSESSAYALTYALAIAARHGAEVELLHVAENSAYADETPMPGDAPGETFEAKLRGRLREIAESARDDMPIETNLLLGVPYIEILDRAQDWPADLVVMGTHGRTGMKHLLIGSVAEKVVRTASCPVCTVRHPDHVMDLKEHGQ